MTSLKGGGGSEMKEGKSSEVTRVVVVVQDGMNLRWDEGSIFEVVVEVCGT